METVHLDKVVSDIDQPRKLFEPEKLALLRKSVEKHGVMSPLIVEKMKDGKFLIIDGERRYRVAKDLGLKSVPIVLMETKSAVDRVVQQFHIQEQHENWTTAEKAMVVYKLSRELGVNITDACRMLGIGQRTGEKYLAFASLIEKESFMKARLDIGWAGTIGNLKRTMRSIYNDEFKKEFDRNEEKKTERAVLSRIIQGDIRSSGDIMKLKDAFRQDPKSIKKFFDTTVSPEKLFVDTNAKSAYHLRNLKNNAGYLYQHLRLFMEKSDTRVDGETMQVVERAHAKLKNFIDRYSKE